MAEQINLTSPIVPPTINFYKVVGLVLNRGLASNEAEIAITLAGPNGERVQFYYSGLTAFNLIVALNKMNLSVISLERRILNQLISDGKLVGTVTGTPD